jgi:hypothetical protein
MENKLDFRSAPEVLRSKQHQSGIDAKRLLEWVAPMLGEVRYAPAVELLRVVFEQQYEVVQGEIQRVKIHATGVVCNPHDVDAQWSAKREKRWVGYKVQVAETIAQAPERGQEPAGRFITSVVTQKATESDDAGVELTLEAQKAAGVQKPAELYVDGAYVSGVHLKSAIEQNYELVGPAQPSAGRANIPEAYRIEAFTIDIAGRQAICPGGFKNTQCSRLEESAVVGSSTVSSGALIAMVGRSSPNASGLSKDIVPQWWEKITICCKRVESSKRARRLKNECISAMASRAPLAN